MSDRPATSGEPPEFLPRFLRLLPMMLVFGIVGPIFLFAYFALDEPGTEWMLWWGIAVLVLDVGLAAGIAWFVHRGAAKVYRLGRTGRRATAEVLSIEQTGTEINNQPLIRLRLRIHGPDVNAFEVEARKIVPLSALGLLHARAGLAVLVDPETREWEIDWDGTSRLAAQPPAVPAQSAEQRLAELDALRAKELISNEEYAATRQRILDEL